MKKKILGLLLIVVAVITLTACNKSNEFKDDYESVNGKENASGKIHRTLDVDVNNPYEKVDTSTIIEKIENKETFYVYFGDKLCPWCRSVIEKSIEAANLANVKKIYYVEIWDDEGNEVVRDKYTLENNKPVKTIEGTDDYYKLLDAFSEVLSDYNLTDEDGNSISTGEKRIYAPNYIYVKEGVPVRFTEGISEMQTDSREELSEEILKDEEKLFKEFFNYNK